MRWIAMGFIALGLIHSFMATHLWFGCVLMCLNKLRLLLIQRHLHIHCPSRSHKQWQPQR